MKKVVLCLVLVFLLTPAAFAADSESNYETSAWAYEDVTRALNLDILDRSRIIFGDLRRPIARGDFAINTAYLVAATFGSNMDSYLLIKNYRGMAESITFPLLYSSQVAKDLGIIMGRENGDLDADSTITRQEAAVMLARAYRIYQDSMPESLRPLSYTDQSDIADWALEDVMLMSHLGIMNGVEDGRFDPLGLYTTEQCVVTLLRLYEKAPYDGKKENPFTISRIDGGYMKIWDDGNQSYSFAIETDNYYICARVHDTRGAGLGSNYYYIDIVDQDFTYRSYPTAIILSSSSRGDYHAKPENPLLSEDGTKLSYTATVLEDAYRRISDADGNLNKKLLFSKGIYTVIMDLKTGEQIYSRTDLPK